MTTTKPEFHGWSHSGYLPRKSHQFARGELVLYNGEICRVTDVPTKGELMICYGGVCWRVPVRAVWPIPVSMQQRLLATEGFIDQVNEAVRSGNWDSVRGHEPDEGSR